MFVLLLLLLDWLSVAIVDSLIPFDAAWQNVEYRIIQGWTSNKLCRFFVGDEAHDVWIVRSVSDPFGIHLASEWVCVCICVTNCVRLLIFKISYSNRI